MPPTIIVGLDVTAQTPIAPRVGNGNNPSEAVRHRHFEVGLPLSAVQLYAGLRVVSAPRVETSEWFGTPSRNDANALFHDCPPGPTRSASGPPWNGSRARP